MSQYFSHDTKIMFFSEKRKGCDDVATFSVSFQCLDLEIEVNLFGVE